MALHQTWKSGVLIREDDDVARTVKTWNDAGTNLQSRAFTAEENTRADQVVADRLLSTNETSIRDKLRVALAANDTYIALSTPTAAQTAAQVKALSRTMNGLIRLSNRSLESDS